MRVPFTPGPWVLWIASGEAVRVLDSRCDQAIVAYADIPKSASALSQRNANARLIAAAPELLEALCDLMSYHDVPGPVDAPLKPLLDAGFAAIRKSRGETL